MTIRICQSSEQVSEKHWKWSVWLDGPGDDLDKIKSVIYQLHSSFKNPLRETKDRDSGFRLDSAGWGQFMIYLTLFHHDGSSEKRHHWLRFGENAPSKELQDQLGVPLVGGAPTAFLSYSIADTAAAMMIRKNLEQKGITVLDASTVSDESSLDDSIENMIDRSDFGVSIISDLNSNWVDQDMQIMQSRELPVLQVYTDSISDKKNLDLKVNPVGKAESSRLASLIDPSISLDKFKF